MMYAARSENRRNRRPFEFYLLLGLLFSLVLFSFQIFSIEGKPFRFFWAFILLLVVSKAFKIVINGVIIIRPYLSLYIIVFFIVIYHLVCLFMVLDSDTGFLIEYLFMFSQIILVLSGFIFVSQCHIGMNEFTIITRLWFLLAIIVSLIAAYQLFADIFGWWMFSIEGINDLYLNQKRLFGYLRPCSVFSEPAHLGNFLIPVILLVFISMSYRIVNELFFRTTKWNILGLFLITLTLLMAFSMKPIATFIAAIVVAIVVVQNKRLYYFLFKGALVFALLILAFYFSRPELMRSFYDRIAAIPSYIFFNEEVFGNAVSPVIPWWRGVKAGVIVWLQKPLTGFGLDQYQFVVEKYVDPNQLSVIIHTGSPWAQLLADIGLIGVSLYALFYFCLMRHLILVSRQGKYQTSRVLPFCFVIMLISDMINLFFSGAIFGVRQWFNIYMAILFINMHSRHFDHLGNTDRRKPAKSLFLRNTALVSQS